MPSFWQSLKPDHRSECDPPGGSGAGTLYWYGSGGEVLEETDLSGTLQNEYVFFGGKRVARYSATNGYSFYFSDHLGSADVVTDALGNIKEESDYYPFGGERIVTDLGIGNNYKFTGKERDPETGCDYFGARYYCNPIGRFITPDWAAAPTAVPYAHFGNPQSLNLYSYVQNNPTTFGDPDGHQEPIENTVEVGLGWAAWEALKELSPHAAGILAGTAAGLWIKSKVDSARDTITDVLNHPGSAAPTFCASPCGPVDQYQMQSNNTNANEPGHTTQPPVPDKSTVVIGKVADLNKPGALQPGERKLDLPNQGSPKANWAQNSSKLREAMNEGNPIRDAAVNKDGTLRDNTGFLRAERNELRNKGWTYDKKTTTWNAPQ